MTLIFQVEIGEQPTKLTFNITRAGRIAEEDARRWSRDAWPTVANRLGGTAAAAFENRKQSRTFQNQKERARMHG